MKLHTVVTVAILTVALALTLYACGAAHGMQPKAQTGFAMQREGDSLLIAWRGSDRSDRCQAPVATHSRFGSCFIPKGFQPLAGG